MLKKSRLINSVLFILLFFAFHCTVEAQEGKNSLNKDLEFHADHILYKGKKITLGPRSFYIDGQLTSTEAAKYSYVFNSVNEAAKHLTNGTEASPMVLYIA